MQNHTTFENLLTISIWKQGTPLGSGGPPLGSGGPPLGSEEPLNETRNTQTYTILWKSSKLFPKSTNMLKIIKHDRNHWNIVQKGTLNEFAFTWYMKPVKLNVQHAFARHATTYCEYNPTSKKHIGFVILDICFPEIADTMEFAIFRASLDDLMQTNCSVKLRFPTPSHQTEHACYMTNLCRTYCRLGSQTTWAKTNTADGSSTANALDQMGMPERIAECFLFFSVSAAPFA